MMKISNGGVGQSLIARRKGGISFVLFVLFIVCFFTVELEAQETAVSPFEATASANFGQSITFRLAGETHPAVQTATLFFTFPLAESIYVQEIVPSEPNQLSIEQIIDLQPFSIRPFSTITYWWEIETSEGKVTLAEQTLLYEDDRLAWAVISHSLLTVHTVESDAAAEALADQAEAIVMETLPKLRQTAVLSLTTPLSLYIYPSAADFQRTARLANYAPPPITTGADLGILLQTAVNPRTASQDLARDLPRELVRLAIVQHTGRPYADLPAWFVEGVVAHLVEADGLETAVLDDVLPFDSLCSPITFVQNEPLATQQSAAFVHYLVQQYGPGILAQLLDQLAQGAECDTLILRTINIESRTLTQQWLATQQRQLNGQQLWTSSGLWLLLLFASTLLLGALWFRQQQ